MGRLQFDLEILCWVLFEQKSSSLVLGVISSVQSMKEVSCSFPLFSGQGFGGIISGQFVSAL